MRRRGAVVSLAVLGFAACGETGDVVEVASPEGVAAAATSSIDEGTARFEFDVTMDLSSVGVDDPLVLRGEGQQDLANNRVAATVDMSAVLGASGDALPPGVGAAFDEPLETIQDGSDMYICGGPLAALETRCAHVDLADVVGEQAITEALGGSSADPSAMLQLLAGAGEVEEVGTEEIDGVATTHLRGTTTVAQSLERLSDEAEEQYRDSLRRMGIDEDIFDAPQPFEAWVGQDDTLVYRVVQEMELPLPSGTTRVSYDIRYTDHGEPVDIEIPTEFVELDELVPQAD